MAASPAIITIIGSGAQTVLYGFVMLLLGIPIYVWLKRASTTTETTT
jgi:basic amino acid/polyamine antiporter, APA family